MSTVVHIGLYDQFKDTYERRRGEECAPEVDEAAAESLLERLAAASRDFLYGRLFRWVRGSMPEAEIDSRMVREHFRGPMRLFALGGLGTHFVIYYGLALALAGSPELILPAAAVIVAGFQNVVVVAAVVAWAKAEGAAQGVAAGGS